MRRILLIAGLTVLLLGAGGVVFVYSGAYNVAAANHDSRIVRWVLHTTMERSVERRAQGITPPVDMELSDPQLIRAGFEHYDEMCIACHGAPGVEPAELAEGLNPSPPDLTRHAGEMSVQELFWIIKNGVKMTGMPAWGTSHSDEKIWAMVAFVKHLPNITAADYKALQSGPKAGPGDEPGHSHVDGYAH